MATASEATAASPPSNLPESARSPELWPLWQALREIDDPEVPVSIVDLGLVCDVRRDGGHVDVDITFTATACPAMGFIQEDIRERLLREPGVDSVATHVTWERAWTAEHVSELGRERLKRFGITL